MLPATPCRRAALADQDPVEHLQHEDRGDQQQQVNEKGQARNVEERAAEELEEWLHEAGRLCQLLLTPLEEAEINTVSPP